MGAARTRAAQRLTPLRVHCVALRRRAGDDGAVRALDTRSDGVHLRRHVGTFNALGAARPGSWPWTLAWLWLWMRCSRTPPTDCNHPRLRSLLLVVLRAVDAAYNQHPERFAPHRVHIAQIGSAQRYCPRCDLSSLHGAPLHTAVSSPCAVPPDQSMCYVVVSGEPGVQVGDVVVAVSPEVCARFVLRAHPVPAQLRNCGTAVACASKPVGLWP